MTSFEGIQKGNVENDTEKYYGKASKLGKDTSLSKISGKILSVMSNMKSH